MLLAGDIGGTKTVLAVFSPEAGAHAPLAEATFPSGRYGRLEAIVREFLAQITFPIEQGLSGLPGLEQLRSISKFGLSQVVVTFADGTDIYLARQLVTERIGTVVITLRSNHSIGLLVASVFTMVGSTRVSMGPAMSVSVRGVQSLPASDITAVATRAATQGWHTAITCVSGPSTSSQ